MTTVLFFGDIVGKIGRQALQAVLPDLKKEFQPDLVIANVENIAHGNGITEKTLQDALAAGVDFCTSGNHVLGKQEAESLLVRKDIPLIRPANYPPGLPGDGYRIVEVASRPVAIVNMMGRVFMKEDLDCPFRGIDVIIAECNARGVKSIIIDFHAEATSEKTAFAHYVDGRATAVIGTHTHIPTADTIILAGGTARVTDAGMAGALDSVIGVRKEPIIKSFLTQTGRTVEIPEEGEAIVNGVMVQFDPMTGRATAISRVDRQVRI